MRALLFRLDKNLLLALAVIIGTTIGAGIFGIPYVIVQSGLITSFFYFVVLGTAVLFLHLFFSEVVLRTKDKHRLTGYAHMYLGRRGGMLIAISTLIGTIGAFLVYIILGGNFLYTIFSAWWAIPPFYWSLIFWGVLSVFIFLGIKFIGPLEFLMSAVFVGIVLLVFAMAFPKINLQDVALFNLPNIFLPYGVLFFSFAGWLAIPEASSVLKNSQEKKRLKEVIILATVIVMVVYLLFSVAVIGVSGNGTTKDALFGLVPFLGERIVLLGALFGVIAVASSALVLGNYLKNALRYDYGVPTAIGIALTCGMPLILFLLGLREFITTISLIGAFIGVVEGISIVVIFQKAKHTGSRLPEYNINMPKFLPRMLVVIFVLGALAEAYWLLV